MDNQLTKEDVLQITKADDLKIAPFREDGVTYGTPTWIWSVRVGETIYVRAYNGTNSRWYKAALSQKTGKIIAAGMTKEVRFEPVTGEVNRDIDKAYQTKYQGSPYLGAMVNERAREATIRVIARDVISR